MIQRDVGVFGLLPAAGVLGRLPPGGGARLRRPRVRGTRRHRRRRGATATRDGASVKCVCVRVCVRVVKSAVSVLCVESGALHRGLSPRRETHGDWREKGREWLRTTQ